ncbi:MAG: SocA family protein [Symploca sp. SIO2B6]|nr:SocA family protein [Symploca sp. SIO2B6]
MEIKFQFYPEKAVEAAAVLLRLHGKPMKYLGLLKMLYIADRVALKQMDQPITGDSYVSMDYGPVPSNVYDLIKQKPTNGALELWSEFIGTTPSSKCVKLKKDPGVDELCEEEEEILKQVYCKFGNQDPFEVANWTHQLPEWQNPHGSAIPISIESVLHYIGKSDRDIQLIRQDALRESYLDGALNG